MGAAAHPAVYVAAPPPLHGARAAALSAAGTTVPSLAVGVAQHGRVLWEEAFGLAVIGGSSEATVNPGAAVHATPDTLYSLASVSKPFTATALMVLVERRQVVLDAPINDYLHPSAQVTSRAGPASQATVRRVVNHSAGLPLHYNFWYDGEIREGLLPSRDDTIRRYAATINRAGEQWQYSNLGYGLLDRVISRAGGMQTSPSNASGAVDDSAWGRCLERDVLRPLGLARTAVGPLGPALAPLAAQRYQTDVGRFVQLEGYDCDHPGAASVWSSVHDVLHFGMFHCTDAVGGPLSAAARQEMQRSTALSGEAAHAPGISPPGYGIGWMVTPTTSGHTLIHHGGGMMGVSTMLMMVPAEGLVVAVLCNGRGPAEEPQPATAVAETVLSALLPGYRTHQPAPMPLAAAHTDGVDDAQTLKAELAGSWRGSIAVPIATPGSSDPSEQDDSGGGDEYRSGERRLRLALTVSEAGEVTLRLGGSAGVPLQRAQLVPVGEAGGKVLTGYFDGTIGTEDAGRRPHELHLTLRLREEPAGDGASTTGGGRRVLEGGVTAMMEQQSGFRPAPAYALPRGGNAVCSWCRLVSV